MRKGRQSAHRLVHPLVHVLAHGYSSAEEIAHVRASLILRPYRLYPIIQENLWCCLNTIAHTQTLPPLAQASVVQSEKHFKQMQSK